MLFNSPEFIFLFLPVVIIVYFSLTHNRLVTAAKLWLTLSSLFFYSYWNPIYLPLIVGSIVVNFGLGISIQNARFGGSAMDGRGKLLFLIGIAANVGLLGYFKYADFFIANINWISDGDIAFLNLALPLAISFFTFQQIAFLSDCYRVKLSEKSFLNYALFVTFFPQLISGPIVHHKEMMPQFQTLRAKRLNYSNILQGLFIFSIGLFKKVVIADTLSVWSVAGYDSGIALGNADAWQTAVAYTLQIYFDFSGYCDMAIGAALMLNIRLPINFMSPYRTTNIQEHWQRWHMTLSQWLKDYVYIPLGGNRKGTVRLYVNLMITMLVGGLWHGAAWTFVIWGGLHGLALTVHRFWQKTGIRIHAIAATPMLFLFLVMAFVIFRSTSMSQAIAMYGYMNPFGPSSTAFIREANFGHQLPFGFIDLPFEGMMIASPLSVAYTVVALAIVWLTPNALQISQYVEHTGPMKISAGRGMAVITALLIFTSSLTFLGIDQPSEFLYFNF